MCIEMLVRLALAATALGSCAARGSTSPDPVHACVVARIVDGDTFYCRDGRKVRLLGVDSPETGQGSVAGDASRGLADLIAAGRAVRLEGDVAPTDRYGRVLAWVWIGGTLVNEAMVRRGWAVTYTVPPNVKYAQRLVRAQSEARASGAGLWARGGFDCPPRAFRRGECVSSP